MPSSWERLGMIVGGMRNAGDDAYRKRLGDNLVLGQRGATLSRDLMENKSLESGLGDALMAQGYSPEEAALVVQNSRAKSGSDFAATLLGMGRRQEQQFRQNAAEQAGEGDWNAANALLMGVANGPQELPKVVGDILLGNRFVEGGDVRGPTEIGQARIRAQDATTGLRHAQAGAADARADLSRRTDPNRPRGGKSGKVPAGVSYERTPEVEALEAEIGRKLTDQDLYDMEQGTFHATAPMQAGDMLTAPLPANSGPIPASAAPSSAGAGATVQLRIQQARDAIAAGKDPVAVREMLGRMGINPSAAGL